MAEALAHMPSSAPDQEGVRIARNTGYLTVAFVIQKVLSFGFFVFYARVLGPADTGRLSGAIALATLFAVLIDLGFSPILIREVARRRERASELLSNVLWVKVFFATVTYLALIVFTYGFAGGYDSATRQLIFIAGAVTVLESMTLSYYGVLRGFQNLTYEAIGSTLFQIVAVSIGVALMFITRNVFVPAIALLTGAITNFLYALFVTWRRYGIRPSLAHRVDSLTFLIQQQGPFLLSAILTRIYAMIDVVLLSLLASETSVGWYAAANKILLAIQFIPLAFNNSIYPAMSEYFISAKERFAVLFDRVVFFLASIAFPLMVGLILFANQITPLLSDAYTESILPLQIVSGAIFFMFLNVIFSSYLNAADAQRWNTINLTIVVLMNIVLNLILVPVYHEVGTSIALLASAVVLFFCNSITAHRVLPMHGTKMLSGIIRTALSAAVMGIVLWYTRTLFSVSVLIPLGVLLYAVLWVVVGGKQARETVRLFRRVFARTKPI